MSVDTKQFLTRVRKRATAGVLGYAESQPWYRQLTTQQRIELRDKVLSANAAYHDAVLDVIATLDGAGGVHNERALELLEILHDVVVRRERPLVVTDGRS